MDYLKDKIYHLPKPPPRTRSKPLQLICVGPPRSATESLGLALRKLGITTYHGWDIVFEQNPGYIQEWAHLARRKWRGAPNGDVYISTAEFDTLIGHVEAVIDIAASVFAAELIAAYPDAKVILNTRRDLDAWHRSALKTIVGEIEDRLFLRILRFFSADFFWAWEMFVGIGFAGLFRAESPKRGILYNGKWVYREHCNMIRGLVSKERLLEWSVEDGWEPLCEFLGKSLPDEPFPKTNDPVAFSQSVNSVIKPRFVKAIRNMILVLGSSALLVAAIGLGIRNGGWRWIKLQFSTLD